MSESESEIIMDKRTWLAPALYGGCAGAIALAIIGFTWGGWVTGGTARQMSDQAANSAVVAMLVPYCLDKSKNDPGAGPVLAELSEASGYNRRGIVEKAGWATPLGEERPVSGLALACEKALATN